MLVWNSSRGRLLSLSLARCEQWHAGSERENQCMFHAAERQSEQTLEEESQLLR